MTDPQPYQWAYDRSEWGDRPDPTTFSVGVYQWLPKVAGGVKKSSTVRVNGYVADAAAAYAKADELCDRLNRERARLDDRPAWLQKSYAVPKPAGFEKPRRSADMTAAEARIVRDRAVKPLLRAAGYVQTHASTFGCRCGEVVRMMHFQTSQWGPEFTVNLSLHPTFVPATGELPDRVRWSTVEHHHCTLRSGIGFRLPPELDRSFPFGSDAAELADICASVATGACEVLDGQAALLERWCREPMEHLGFVRPFVAAYPTTLLACAEMRLGRLDAAEARLREAIASAADASPPWHARLLDVVGELRAVAGDPIGTSRLLEWLID